jgi:glycosyltransferase involved in cell wall biosynthesis
MQLIDPLVSIVLPIYNQEKFLPNALQDVCAQKYTNIEIIAVNDGSTDNSLNLLREAAEKDKRIAVVNQANGGLVAATATGIIHASGEYVCFFDPDDRIGPDFIESFVKLLDNEYDFVAQGFSYQYPNKKIPFSLKADCVFETNELRALADSYILDQRLALDNNIFVARWNKMYRRDCLESFVNEYFESRAVSIGEDSLFTYMLLMHASSARTSAHISSYRYVQHESSMMRSGNWSGTLSKIKTTYACFSAIVSRYSGGENAASYLLYALASGLLSSTMKGNVTDGKELFHQLQSDDAYRHSVELVSRYSGMRNFNALLQYIGCPAGLYALILRLHALISK